MLLVKECAIQSDSRQGLDHACIGSVDGLHLCQANGRCLSLFSMCWVSGATVGRDVNNTRENYCQY